MMTCVALAGYEGYTTHAATDYIGPRTLKECVDDEGGASCKQRCDDSPSCLMFGLYQSGSRAGRCCIKFYGPEVGAQSWDEGSHFVKSR